MLKKIPHTYTIIFSIILLCAVLSWIIPAGEYSRHTVEVNGTTRSVIVDNSYHAVESVPQTWQVFSALLQGFEKQAGIIAFLLIIGGDFFFFAFYAGIGTASFYEADRGEQSGDRYDYLLVQYVRGCFRYERRNAGFCDYHCTFGYFDGV